MSRTNQIKRIMQQAGGYRCRHFKLKRMEVQSTCCSSRSEDFAPTCKLINGFCPGLAQCPRLGVEEKSKLIQLWREDLVLKKQIDPTPFLE